MREFWLLACAIVVCSISLGSSYQSYKLNGKDTINIVDINGKKQGYWIITGDMRNLPEFKSTDIIEEGKYENSRRIGFWKKYFPGNKIRSKVMYASGRPNGEFITYFENGQVEESGNWVSSGRGKYTGAFKRYYPNGKVAQEKAFSDEGKTEGVVKYYHENGQLELEYSSVAGVESGKMRRYYPNGDLKEEKNFSNGVVDAGSVKKFEMKKPVVEIEEAEPAKVVKEAVSDAESKPNIGKLNCNGYNKLFNRNRQVTKDGMFKNCELYSGKWHKYNRDGLEIAIEVWKDGKYVGDTVIEE